MSRLWMVVAIGVVLGMASTAEAQGKRSAAKGAIVLPEVQVTGHAGLAIEVARISPVKARAEFKRPLLEKVEAAAYKEPF